MPPRRRNDAGPANVLPAPPRRAAADVLLNLVNAAAIRAEASLRQRELAANAEFDLAQANLFAENPAPSIPAARERLRQAARAIRRLRARRRARGELPLAPGGREYTGPIVTVTGRTRRVPAEARLIARALNSRQLPAMWPPADPNRNARLPLPPWAALPEPRIYNEAEYGRIEPERFNEVFTDTTRDIIFSDPDVGLRYGANFGERRENFVIDGRDRAALIDAITTLLMSTNDDFRMLFRQRVGFAVMFRLRVDIYNNMRTTLINTTNLNMASVNLTQYFEAARTQNNWAGNERRVNLWLRQNGFFDDLLRHLDGLLNNLSAHGGSTPFAVVTGLEMFVIPIQGVAQPVAGCERRTRRTISEHGMMLFDAASTQENCFFAHALPLVGVTYSVARAREQRELFNFPPNGVPLTVDNMVEWATANLLHLTLYRPDRTVIFDNGHLVGSAPWAEGEDPLPFMESAGSADTRLYLRLLLADGHVSRIHALMDGKRTCEQCGTKWSWQHTCNALKANFFAREVKEKNFIRKAKIAEDPVDLGDVMVFDIEGLIDQILRRSEAYAVGFAFCDDLDNVAFTWGAHAMAEFIDILVLARPKFLIAFNGRTYDFFLLCRALTERGISVSNIIFDGGKMLSATVNGCTRLFDLFNFVPMSLRKAAKSFKLDVAKGIFPHKFVAWDTLDYDGPWPENAIDYFFSKDREEALDYLAAPECPKTFNLKEECLRYLRGDVQCLGKLFIAVNNSYQKRFDTNATRFATGPQAGFAIMLASLPPQVELEVPKHRSIALFLKEAYFGGMVQPYRAYAEGVLDIADVNGLYPYIMANRDMPVGESRWMSRRELANPPRDKLFVIEFTYDPPKDLYHPVLPYRSPEGLLRYTCEARRGTHPSNKFWLAIELGYTITAVHCGRIWDKKAPFMRPVMLLHQEHRRAAKAAKNDAEQYMSKTDANSTYGKFGQSPKARVVQLCQDANQVRKFLQKYLWTDAACIGQRTLYMIGEKQMHPENSGYSKPLQVAIFITSFAQEHLIRAKMVIDPGLRNPHAPIFYEDTDSIHTDKEVGYAALQAAGLVGPEPGQFSSDLKKNIEPAPVDAYVRRAMYLRPKLYYTCMEQVFEDGTRKQVDDFASKGIPNYLWKRDDADAPPPASAPGNAIVVTGTGLQFFEAVVKKMRDGDPRPIVKTVKFEALRNTGLSGRHGQESLSHQNIEATRTITDGWTGRRLCPRTLLFYPIGHRDAPPELPPPPQVAPEPFYLLAPDAAPMQT